MTFSNCKACGASLWSGDKLPHKCPPCWEAFIEGWGDPEDPHTVYAHDAEDAAKDHFESRDDEPGEHFESEHVVCVRRSASEPWQRFSVRREAVIEYHATAIDEAEAGL